MATSFGTFFELGGTAAMEALGSTGLDYVIIDTEHAPFSVAATADYIIAAENCGIEPLVRIGSTQRADILRMLDIGARGLIVPNIRSLNQVCELVSAAKFPPVGQRGFCPTRTSSWGTQEWAHDVEAYMAEANRRAKVIPQCETQEALTRIEDIVAMEGVDGIFVGPFDLSVGLGIPLQLDHPQLTEAIETILEACKKHGKQSYIFASTVEDTLKWAQRGFDSVAYNLDAAMLIEAFQDKLRTFKESL